MCEDIIYEHDKYIKFVDELKSLEKRSHIMLTEPFNTSSNELSMKDMENIRYIGCELEYFYLLASIHNTTKVLCKFNIDAIYRDEQRGTWFNSIDVIRDEKDKITVRHLSSSDFLYFEFKNMILSGVVWRCDRCDYFSFHGIEMGKNAYPLKCEMSRTFSQSIIWVSLPKGLDVQMFKPEHGYKAEHFYGLLLDIFDESIEIIKNDPIFILNSIYFMCKMYLMIIDKHNETVLTSEKMNNEMFRIVSWRECELVKNTENVLRNEIFFECEPLFILILRAIVYEHSLLLHRMLGNRKR